MRDGMSLGDVLEDSVILASIERMPVLNREPRSAVGKDLRYGLWLRDGGTCWICGRKAYQGVADHVRPRSNWPADLLQFADRSDNLRLACWDCNERKSNLNYQGGTMPLGVTTWCVRCRPEFQYDFEDRQVRCFCIHCGMGGLVPSEECYLSAEESCGTHPGRPARGCDRCAEEGVA